MHTADNQLLYAGRTVFVLSHGNVVEHVVSSLDDGLVWFEQPEAEGPFNCLPSEAYAWLDAAVANLDVAACTVSA